jgi:hypothetical protein
LLVLYGYKTCTKSKTLAFVWFSYLIQWELNYQY